MNNINRIIFWYVWLTISQAQRVRNHWDCWADYNNNLKYDENNPKETGPAHQYLAHKKKRIKAFVQ